MRRGRRKNSRTPKVRSSTLLTAWRLRAGVAPLQWQTVCTAWRQKQEISERPLLPTANRNRQHRLTIYRIFPLEPPHGLCRRNRCRHDLFRRGRSRPHRATALFREWRAISTIGLVRTFRIKRSFLRTMLDKQIHHDKMRRPRQRSEAATKR